jgi:filamentous hemagglutinin
MEGYVIPKGFSTADDYQAFVSRLRAGVGEEVEPVFQGSAVTGKSHVTGQAFDVGRLSDFDIGLIGRELFERAGALGGRTKTQPNRIGPIEPGSDLARQLGLDGTLQELIRLSDGRPVKFMLYEDLSQALKRPSLLVPGG